MSEVKVFNCVGYLEQRSRIGGDRWVSVDDFDRVTAERDAALETLKASRQVGVSDQQTIQNLVSERDAALGHVADLREDLQTRTADLLECGTRRKDLQQRLTAADEQVHVLETEVARLNRVKLSLKELADSRADNCSVYRQHLTEALTMAEKVRDASLGMKRKCLTDLIVHLYQNSDAAPKPAEGGGDEA